MLVAIDTATEQASLSLHDGLRIRAEHTWEAPRRHTTELSPRLEEAMDQARVSRDRLRGVAVVTGPGSFTGLRIGMSVAKGLALALGIPVIGIPTLDVVAYAQGPDERRLAAVLEAGRGRISVVFYRWVSGRWRPLDDARLTSWADMEKRITEPTLFCGEVDRCGAEALARLGDSAVLLSPARRLRRAGFLAELGWQRLRRGEVDDPAALTPVYLRQPIS